ncbi:hypothetical protein GH5_01802 [Leishmania sp. Ghana 2012 LV757]|uniref:hypothetical protein n=1 Tax=Leishmania sp. Ghana 2012 LV757 TaxID=2803181 RepID=UPI001B5D07E9|nr:hypothetical protein GH5_01781 [Leishmania sp. Ghana 2012 LV757]KAG5493073.1 hypothetical protein GH5_01802 [Leishmania sp. Ghana 2012 LV757]
MRTWRHLIQRYSGFVSAYWTSLGAMPIFLWSFKSHRQQQRIFQAKRAAIALTQAQNPSGKAALCRNDLRLKDIRLVHVDVRGAEATPRSMVWPFDLGAGEVCGD